MPNPLLSDRDLEFVLYELLDAQALCRLAPFSEHSRATFDAYVGACRRLAREVLMPSYRPIDAQPPRFENGQVTVHSRMREMWPRLKEPICRCFLLPVHPPSHAMHAGRAGSGPVFMR